MEIAKQKEASGTEASEVEALALLPLETGAEEELLSFPPQADRRERDRAQARARDRARRFMIKTPFWC